MKIALTSLVLSLVTVCAFAVTAVRAGHHWFT